MRALILALLVLALTALATCARDTGEPDPPVQVLAPCVPTAPEGDPLACPPGLDAGIDAPSPDAPVDAGIDAPPADALTD